MGFRATKRGRQDGHLSRDEYNDQQQKEESAPEPFLPSTFNRAAPNVLQTRKIVFTREQEYRRHIRALNKGFTAIIQRQFKENKRRSWTENLAEYLEYYREIDQKYGKKHSGNLFTFGSGDCGQLAHGVEDDRDMIVKYPRPVQLLRKYQITRVACGGLHSAAVTSEGVVFTWGCNDDGALGRDGEENFPARVEGFPQNTAIVHVVAGDCHTAALTISGEVFTWGSYKDKDGKAWCDASEPKSSFKNKQLKPFRIEGLSHVKDLKCGDAYNLALTESGSVYSWGLGEMGQLGRPVIEQAKDSEGNYLVEKVYADHLIPKKVLLNGKDLPPVKTMGCGSYHSLFCLASNGYLYTSGLNNYGQLGIGNVVNSMELCLVEDLQNENIVQVDGGTHHSVVLTMEGVLYAFGRGDSAQLGNTDVQQASGYYVDRPQRVTFGGSDKELDSIKVRMITVGANHALVLDEKNVVYSWGYGEMLALGTGKEKDEQRPRALDWSKTSLGEDAEVVQVEAGGQHSAILAVRKDGNQLFTQ